MLSTKLILFLITGLLFLGRAQALEVKFLGVSSMLLSDEKASLLFDAPFTRPGFLHWLNLRPFRTDEELVRKALLHHKVRNLKALFVSHHHVDHAVDTAFIAKFTHTKAYGDENLMHLMPVTDRKEHFEMVKEGEQIKIGNFTVLPFQIDHGPLPLEFLFDGVVPQNFNYSLYDYQEGATWFYLITHGEKKILWNGSTGNALAILKSKNIPVRDLDLYVLGLGADSLKEKIAGLKGELPFHHFIPVHFDNFFRDYDFDRFIPMPFNHVEEEIKELRNSYPKTLWTLPELGRTYEI